MARNDRRSSSTGGETRRLADLHERRLTGGRDDGATLTAFRIRPAVAGRLGIGALVLVVVLLAIVVRLITIKPAAVTLRPTLATTVQLPGNSPLPDWPSSGEAALTVQGVGSLGSSGESGRDARPIASLAKIMTAYLTLREHPLAAGSDGFTITVTAAQAQAYAADVAADQSTVAVKAGEQLTERQLLEALLIPSADNVAQILAADDAGSEQRFVARMNAQASSLGMTRTTYADASGFDPATVSTASDQLRILQRAMKLPAFRQIVAMSSAELPVAGTVTNYNPLIADGYYGKTGSDSAAAGCLAFFKYVTVAGRRLTVAGVVLGQGSGSSTSVILGAAADAAENLVGSARSALRVYPVVRAKAPVLMATSADKSNVRAVTAGRLSVIGWGGLRERLTVRTRTVKASLSKGQLVGQVSLAGNLPTPVGKGASARSGSGTRTVVRTRESLPAPGFGWRLAHLL
jgi:D-alanyl-D-alanine carboxypeptidase (penicillin-binding protein 5/6)